MSRLTLVIENWGHKELEPYLKSLNGINDVKIKNEDKLEIYIEYDSDIIKWKIIKMEIFLFLNILKVPSLISFNKYSDVDLDEYKIIRNDICCEYCFRGAIDDLFEIEGIEKVESNFEEEDYYKQDYDNRDNVTINVFFNPNILSIEDIKQIDLKLSL